MSLLDLSLGWKPLSVEKYGKLYFFRSKCQVLPTLKVLFKSFYCHFRINTLCNICVHAETTGKWNIRKRLFEYVIVWQCLSANLFHIAYSFWWNISYILHHVNKNTTVAQMWHCVRGFVQNSSLLSNCWIQFPLLLKLSLTKPVLMKI